MGIPEDIATDASFPKSLRLLTSSEFGAVFNNTDYRCGSKELLLLVRKNQLGHARVGFVLAKKHIKLAVDRNRVKRIVRESFRLKRDSLGEFDYVVMARSSIVDLDNQQLRACIDRLWLKLRPAHENRRTSGKSKRRR